MNCRVKGLERFSPSLPRGWKGRPVYADTNLRTSEYGFTVGISACSDSCQSPFSPQQFRWSKPIANTPSTRSWRKSQRMHRCFYCSCRYREWIHWARDTAEIFLVHSLHFILRNLYIVCLYNPEKPSTCINQSAAPRIRETGHELFRPCLKLPRDGNAVYIGRQRQVRHLKNTTSSSTNWRKKFLAISAEHRELIYTSRKTDRWRRRD
jgi:hypothetical protein